MDDVNGKHFKLSKPASQLLQDFFDRDPSCLYPTRHDKEALLHAIRQLPGQDHCELKNISSWFNRHRIQARKAQPPISPASPLYPSLSPKSIDTLEILFHDTPNPSTKTIEIWASAVHASVQDVTAWLALRRERDNTPSTSSTRPQPPPLCTTLQSTDASPSPQLPTPSQSTSPEPYPLVPVKYEPATSPVIATAPPPLSSPVFCSVLEPRQFRELAQAISVPPQAAPPAPPTTPHLARYLRELFAAPLSKELQSLPSPQSLAEFCHLFEPYQARIERVLQVFEADK